MPIKSDEIHWGGLSSANGDDSFLRSLASCEQTWPETLKHTDICVCSWYKSAQDVTKLHKMLQTDPRTVPEEFSSTALVLQEIRA